MLEKRITNYMKAGYPCLSIITHEESRIQAMLAQIATINSYNLFAWSCTRGRINALTGDTLGEDGDPSELFNAVVTGKIPDNSMVLMQDVHTFFADPNPMMSRMFRDALNAAKTRGVMLIASGCEFKVPKECDKLVVNVSFDLPDRDTLKLIIEGLCQTSNIPKPTGAALDSVLDAASGMTTTEAEDAFALSFVEEGVLSHTLVHREKANAIKKNGLLHLVDSKITLEHIGGLELLKTDLLSKRNLFSKAARDAHIPPPRGILAVGQPGSGKSLVAQATGAVFGLPLLQLEASNLFGGVVGETERNWRNVFATAKACAPCCLWIDEVDGLTAGAASSGRTDGGTTGRVIKTILQDMQYNAEGIFFVFTANDIDNLPDPLIDRLDCWSVDLPNLSERAAIWPILTKKLKRDPANYDYSAIAAASEGFSGRQIEQVLIRAIVFAHNEGRDLEQCDIMEAVKNTQPTSLLMADVIDARRKRLAGRANPASAPEITTPVKPTTATRKIAA
jgi:AAA+ superfamily predicted ATPase